MAAFDCTGFARLYWADGTTTEQFIDYDEDTGTLSVWCEDTDDRQYLGQMRDHPALHIRILHTQ